jgi:uncharacterized protein (DUF4213/DUF364 family)
MCYAHSPAWSLRAGWAQRQGGAALSIASELVSIAMDIASRIAMPVIRHVYIPEPGLDPDHRARFGLIALADDSTGFFYMPRDDTRERLKAVIDPRHLVGRDALELVPWFASDDEVKKPLGLGAINALSQHVFRLTKYRLDTAANSLGALAFTPTDHVGMVGFFPPLVERLRSRGIPLTVIEKKPELVQTEAYYTVTLDPSALGACNNVLCTASTLLNDTLDEILEHCRSADHVAVIGPTAGCLPDPLFARGVDIVGSSAVKDLPALLHQVRHHQSWGEAVEKYSIRKTDYPGIAALQERL